MEPKFVTLTGKTLAGYVLKTSSEGNENNRAIPEFWLRYLNEGRAQKLHGEAFVKNHDEYGACFPESAEDGSFEYLIGVEIADGETIEGYDVRKLPAATYAVFKTPPADDAAFSKSIQGTWQYIYAEWFPASGYEFAAGKVDFELYREECVGETGNVCDIYVPVVRKGSEQ